VGICRGKFVSLSAVRLRSTLGSLDLASDAPQAVHAVRDRFKMLWIHTAAMGARFAAWAGFGVTGMVRFQTWRNRPNEHFVGSAVGAHDFVFVPKISIACSADTADPHPAGRAITAVLDRHEAHEPGFPIDFHRGIFAYGKEIS